MALVTCPTCGGDQVRRTDTGAPDHGAIPLQCDQCAHVWSREPRLVCSRCGSDDVEIGAYEGWAYDDIDEAREDPEGGAWSYIDREVFRCRKCNHRWRRSGPPRPYEPHA